MTKFTNSWSLWQRKTVFCKKIVKMIMKIDVLKPGFKDKKAHYEI